MRAQARVPALLACLACGVYGLPLDVGSLNAKQAQPPGVAPYVCDGGVYNSKLLPVTNPMDPFLTQRGDASKGYPRVFMSANASELVVNEDCSFTYSDTGVTSRSLMYYNASLFNINGNYSVSLSVNVTQNAESQGGTGLIVWMRGEGQNAFRSVSLLYLPDKEESSGHGTFHVLTLAKQLYSRVASIDRKCDCRMPVAKDNMVASITAFVEPASGSFTFVCELGGVTVVRRLDMKSHTEGRDTEFVGLETHTARESTFSPLLAQPWHPATQPAPLLTPAVPCKDYMHEVVVFMGVLGAMLVLITWQIKWAADHGSSNYTRGNQPRLVELVVSGIAGLQYFSLIGQAAYLHISIAASEGEEDLAKFGENRYSRFLYTTVGFIVFDTLYNGAVAYGAIAAYRDKLQYGLLRKHWLAYSLLALMCLTNLELLTLFPWDYAQFPLAAHLDGYPSPIVAQLSSLPTVIQNVPVLVIQVLTEGCQPPTRLAATDIILYIILTITMTDTFSHFALQLLPTIEAETRYKETLPLPVDPRARFTRLRSTISTISTTGFSDSERQESGRNLGGQWGLLRRLMMWGREREEGRGKEEEEEEEEEEGGEEGRSQSQVLLQIKGEEAKDEKEEEGKGGGEGVCEEIQERGSLPPSSPSCAVDFRRASSANTSSRSVIASPKPDNSATGLAESAMRGEGGHGAAAGATGEASPV